MNPQHPSNQILRRLAAETGRDVLLFSSVTGQGLDKVLQTAYAVLRESAAS